MPLNPLTTTWPLLLGMAILMLGAGLSTEGQRPGTRDIYEKAAEPPQKGVKPAKP